ncbi:type II secretion system minor pseudopilin GspI [Reinekea sp. G2M2-21]|uniref:type II secretion system minor pseudopilin GspI n=1 Tax=Reinekea sp. G2M2-21 TaxID=2788942 RepID=UPI0018AADF65
MKRFESGFTLIEVMIAILIFGLTASAIALSNAQAVSSARLIQEQTEARWVAQNYLTQMRLEHQLPSAGKKSERVTLNNKTWVVEVETSNVEMELFGPFLRRIQIRTKLENEENFADVLEAVLGESGTP